jgi:hypothetical protein
MSTLRAATFLTGRKSVFSNGERQFAINRFIRFCLAEARLHGTRGQIVPEIIIPAVGFDGVIYIGEVLPGDGSAWGVRRKAERRGKRDNGVERHVRTTPETGQIVASALTSKEIGGGVLVSPLLDPTHRLVVLVHR